MELRYRGISYQLQEALVETIPSNFAPKFLGQPYLVRRPVNPYSSQLYSRKYRGIPYGN
jgi:hypothetical protein